MLYSFGLKPGASYLQKPIGIESLCKSKCFFRNEQEVDTFPYECTESMNNCSYFGSI